MSGTSLDGLDIALCSFENVNDKYQYNIVNAETVSYCQEWKASLGSAQSIAGIALMNLHRDFGIYMGEKVNEFVQKLNCKPDYIAIHGHTVFHQPELKLTVQIGDPAFVAAICGVDVIGDFRSLDVALGGQGAPLVPIGDELLFNEYDYCLNLGGFANISSGKPGRVAYDICPVNIVLNELAKLVGLDFDEGGGIGKSGNVNKAVLAELNALEFYSLKYPKSLGREWVEQQIWPILNNSGITVSDKMRTFYEHIAMQIANNIAEEATVLVTGGGAYNEFFIELLKQQSKSHIILPNNLIIDFKEALIFAFLGLLRIENKINTLASVTGAKVNSVGGCIYKGRI